MPTPEQSREYRRRWLAEGRCGHCGAKRAEDDTETTHCRKCRDAMKRRYERRYARQRAAKPPFWAVPGADPGKPFKYGKTRLDQPRRLNIYMDEETHRAVAALCARHYASDEGKDLEPFQMAHVLREAIKSHRDTGNAYPRRVPRRPQGAGEGKTLCFSVDAEAWEIIERQRLAFSAVFPYTRTAAVRDLIVSAARPVLHTIPAPKVKRTRF